MPESLLIETSAALHAPAGLTVLEACQIDRRSPADTPLRFVARHLTALTGPPLSAAEAAYAHANDCSLLLLWNGETPRSVSGGHATGAQAAQNAVAAASLLGAPRGVGITLDLGAGWPVTADFIRGWVDAMAASPYGGSGLIRANLAEPSFSAALLQALRTPGSARGLLLWDVSWINQTPVTVGLPSWRAGAPSPDTRDMVVGWQFAGGACGGLCDLSVIRTERLIGTLWQPPDPPVASLPVGTANRPSTTPIPTAQVRGRIDRSRYTFQFQAALEGPGGSTETGFVLDTGAFEMLLTERTATSLGLPNLGALDIQGVTGSAAAYQSQVNLRLGTHLYYGVHCVVDPSVQMQLFGLRFFITRNYTLSLDTQKATITVYPPS